MDYLKNFFSQTARVRTQMRYVTVLIAFVLGFVLAFVTLLFYNRFLLISEERERHFTGTEYYHTGYMNAMQEVATEEGTLHMQLMQDVRVLCMVLTHPKYHSNRAMHVRATWGQRCTRLVFVSSELDEELGSVAVVEPLWDTYYDLWNKTREGFRYVHNHYIQDYDWFLKADDDTFVIMENLRHMLYEHNAEVPMYFGYQLIRNNNTYMSGGASYVLSKEALRRFATVAYYNSTLCPEDPNAEDYLMGMCLKNVGVHLIDSRFTIAAEQKPKFFPLNLAAYMEPEWNKTISDWVFELSAFPVELSLNCCSNFTIAFHYASPQDMYMFQFLLYHFQVYGLHRSWSKLPARLSKDEELAKLDEIETVVTVT